MRFAGSVSFRPIRVAFLVPPDDAATVSRVTRLCCCLWGGRYNPIIPFFESGGARWIKPFHREAGIKVAQGYIEFFEPDVLVESASGMAEKLGWRGGDDRLRILHLPRVLSLDAFYENTRGSWVEFAAGADILGVMSQLYEREYKYERRHKTPFALIDPANGNAFFDVVGGRYPSDEALAYIPRAYEQIFDPETLPPSFETAEKLIRLACWGPLSITRHELEESNIKASIAGETFYIFDPTDPGDLIDYWNFRLVQPATPISLEWLAKHRDYIRERIAQVYRPIPSNPFGTHFFTSIHFGNSISDQQLRQLVVEHFSDLAPGSFITSRDPDLWMQNSSGYNPRESKIIAKGKSVSFAEDVGPDRYAKIPAPAPKFVNEIRHHHRSRWINLIVPSDVGTDDDIAAIYPSNLWSPDFPRLSTDVLRVGREGWVLIQQYSIGYSVLRLQTGREAIVGWLKSKGIEACPSEEGQIAAQVIAAAGGLLACGMLADRDTMSLLNKMAEGYAKPVRDGERVTTAIPDRSKHINAVEQHFKSREKRSFGYWTKLQYFVQRSVFRAGLRVQCPTCSCHNWFDLDSIGYGLRCSRCLNEFKFSQLPSEIKKVDWFYRVIGPFAVPDYARGGYAVALTLRCLASAHSAAITWSTGLILKQLKCEVDFIAWHIPDGFLRSEGEEPLVLFGESKSFGKSAIGEDAISSLKKAADHFPGALMVVSSLREIADYADDELERLRDLALWGQRRLYRGRPCNPLIVLTGAELFAEHGMFERWVTEDGKPDPLISHPSTDSSNLIEVAELTQRRYLRLPGWWETYTRLAFERRKLVNLIAQHVAD